MRLIDPCGKADGRVVSCSVLGVLDTDWNAIKRVAMFGAFTRVGLLLSVNDHDLRQAIGIVVRFNCLLSVRQKYVETRYGSARAFGLKFC